MYTLESTSVSKLTPVVIMVITIYSIYILRTSAQLACYYMDVHMRRELCHPKKMSLDLPLFTHTHTHTHTHTRTQ